MSLRKIREWLGAEKATADLGKDTAVTLQRIQTWFESGREPLMSGDACIEHWHTLSAQCQFVKTLPAGARVLDVGAGDGALQVYRPWPAPVRTDLKIYAFAMDKGCHFDLYDGYHIGAWPASPPDFDGMSFEAVNARNFIEHIDDPENFVRWACGKLSNKGSLFLEWPRLESKFLPTAPELSKFGLRVMTGNYYDDHTHKQNVPDLQSIISEIQNAGLTVESVGTARTHYFEDELLTHGRIKNDIVLMTLAYWSFTGWCQYLVARKPAISA